MKNKNYRRLVDLERKMNLKSNRRKIAKVLLGPNQENFDASSLNADVILIAPYNGHRLLPAGLSYPDAFKNGPIIIWETE